MLQTSELEATTRSTINTKHHTTCYAVKTDKFSDQLRAGHRVHPAPVRPEEVLRLARPLRARPRRQQVRGDPDVQQQVPRPLGAEELHPELLRAGRRRR